MLFVSMSRFEFVRGGFISIIYHFSVHKVTLMRLCFSVVLMFLLAFNFLQPTHVLNSYSLHLFI
jgi:hypothetical protein